MKNYIVGLLLAFFIIGCASTPTLSHINQNMKMKTTYHGKITSVKYERKSSFIEDFGTFLDDDIIGSQLGVGDGKFITGIIGGVVASEVYEKNFADEYTMLTILSNGHTYPVYIKGHILLESGRDVKISIDDDKISGISLVEVNK
jgi:outer membrane lipoprotein SlyB